MKPYLEKREATMTDNIKVDFKDEQKKRNPSGSSVEYGYRVEARVRDVLHIRPVALSDGILTTEWREVVFEAGFNPAGIPTESHIRQRSRHELLSHEAAVALAWTIIAQQRHRDIECRLVQYRLETNYTLERKGVVDGLLIASELFRDVKLV